MKARGSVAEVVSRLCCVLRFVVRVGVTVVYYNTSLRWRYESLEDFVSRPCYEYGPEELEPQCIVYSETAIATTAVATV